MDSNQAEISALQPGWNFPYEQKANFVPLTEPARLPGSYEEALNGVAPQRVICSWVGTASDWKLELAGVPILKEELRFFLCWSYAHGK